MHQTIAYRELITELLNADFNKSRSSLQEIEITTKTEDTVILNIITIALKPSNKTEVL